MSPGLLHHHLLASFHLIGMAELQVTMVGNLLRTRVRGFMNLISGSGFPSGGGGPTLTGISVVQLA